MVYIFKPIGRITDVAKRRLTYVPREETSRTAVVTEVEESNQLNTCSLHSLALNTDHHFEVNVPKRLKLHIMD